MPTKAPFLKANSKSGKESGTIYISSEGDYFAEPEIDADLIRDLKSNIYMAGIIRKEILLVFSDKYTIEIKDKAGEVDEDLGKTLMDMCDAPDVKLWSAMQKAYTDVFTYGPGIFNPVWGYEGGDYILEKLRFLPAYTFKDAPYTDYITQGEILQGIVLNAKGEIEYHQIDNDGIVQQLQNVFMVKDPTVPEIAGKGVVLPLIPVIAMIRFALKKQMQQVNRIGAKILFVKITDPQEASALNGNVSDVAYGTELIQKWSTDTSFLLRENMEVIDLKLKDDASNLEVIDALHATLIDFISPTSLIAGKAGLIGSSDKHREQVRSNYVEGIHTWLESAFETLLQQYLDYNNYDGYTVKINIPAPGIDKSDIKAKQADLLSKTQSGFKNEMRALLNQPELDEEGLQKLKEELDMFGPPPGGSGGMFEEAGSFASTQKQVERTLEEKLEDIADELSKDVIKAISNE